MPSSRPVLHTAPCFLEDSEGCHAMGHPADQIPPSLGAPAVRSHCVRMDGGMGGVKVKTQTKPRPCAKFPAASKFFSALRLGALRGLLEEARRGVEDGPG